MADGTCSIDGCGKPVHCRGWCSAHWTRWRRHGDPTITLREWTKREHVVCVVPGCGRPTHAKGWCDKHAHRVRTNGGPYELQRIRGNLVERLLSYVEIDLESGCWRFTGTHDAGGYGRTYSQTHGRQIRVHRVAHELWLGPIPDGYEVDHVWERGCRFRDCVCPDHLEAVTPSVNSLRRERAKRSAG